MEKRWLIKKEAQQGRETEISALAGELSVSEVIARLLFNRGIDSFEKARGFFRPDLSQLHDPFLMKDMDKAVDRVLAAMENKENILIYGDYDVDGTTAVSVVYNFLSRIYPRIDYYIPDRYTEGYGISFQGIDYASDNEVKLIIALDCGIKANDKIDYANTKGVDFIICDHHRPGSVLPAAVAVLDPKREDCHYPYDELSGCGVGFKLMQAIAKKKNIPQEQVLEHLDLLAISIAADIVPITGENRILTWFGLKQINENPSPGIAAILKIAAKALPVDISGLVFIVAPRINAAGRIESGKKAVELLIASDEKSAMECAEQINQHNTDRKSLDKDITKQALDIINADEDLKKAKTTVLFNEEWHKGVIGIVASRLIEQYYRPTILFTKSNNKLTGSARSVRDFDVYEAIEACAEFLEQFGGHKYAAGLTMKEEQFIAFRSRFEAVVASTITEEQLVPAIETEAEISFAEFSSPGPDQLPKFYRVLKQFAPFGPGNMNPVFVSRNVKDTGSARNLKEEHLKLFVYQEDCPNIKLNAIGFGLGAYLPSVLEGKKFDLAYTIEENVWNGKTSLQLMIKDIRFVN